MASALYAPDEGLVQALARWQFTVLSMCVARWEFWAALAWHLGFAGIHTMKLDDSPAFAVMSVPWHNLKILTGLLTFFIVFYTNHCYSRYVRLYGLTKDVFKAIPEAAMTLRLMFSDPEQDNKSLPEQSHGFLAIRYLLAATIIFFRDLPPRDIGEDDWQFLVDSSLLQSSTVKYLSTRSHHTRSTLMIYWAIEVVHVGLGNRADRQLKVVSGGFLAMHEKLREIHETMSLPIPFGYYHVMNLMLFVNILLWGYGMGIANKFLAHVVYLLCLIIFMGMRELSGALADPFGDDIVDFPIGQWVLECWQECVMILEHDVHPQTGPAALLATVPLSHHWAEAAAYFGQPPAEDDPFTHSIVGSPKHSNYPEFDMLVTSADPSARPLLRALGDDFEEGFPDEDVL
mmetsp:Transcript_73489/g.168475  ORF Transcript_73489/g.168475 Transcript_73489/m.168475 type:complete len:401 (+) Transcript_73489:3-1205(+)